MDESHPKGNPKDKSKGVVALYPGEWLSSAGVVFGGEEEYRECLYLFGTVTSVRSVRKLIVNCSTQFYDPVTKKVYSPTGDRDIYGDPRSVVLLIGRRKRDDSSLKDLARGSVLKVATRRKSDVFAFNFRFFFDEGILEEVEFGRCLLYRYAISHNSTIEGLRDCSTLREMLEKEGGEKVCRHIVKCISQK